MKNKDTGWTSGLWRSLRSIFLKDGKTGNKENLNFSLYHNLHIRIHCRSLPKLVYCQWTLTQLSSFLVKHSLAWTLKASSLLSGWLPYLQFNKLFLLFSWVFLFSFFAPQYPYSPHLHFCLILFSSKNLDMECHRYVHICVCVCVHIYTVLNSLQLSLVIIVFCALVIITF